MLCFITAFCYRTSKITIMNLDGNEHRRYRDRKPSRICCIRIMTGLFQRSTKVITLKFRHHLGFDLFYYGESFFHGIRSQSSLINFIQQWMAASWFLSDSQTLFFVSDSPAPCKVFPKTPKIALTIDDAPQSEYQRRKSSGSSVNSNSSAIEPHVYDFQDCEKTAESSLIIRFESLPSAVWVLINCFEFYCFRIPSYSHIPSVNCELPQKLQNTANSTFYRFTRLLNNKPVVNAGDERRTSWDKRWGGENFSNVTVIARAECWWFGFEGAFWEHVISSWWTIEMIE